MKKVMSVVEDVNLRQTARFMLRLIENRLRYLESIKFTTRDDDARVQEMLLLNAEWARYVALTSAEIGEK